MAKKSQNGRALTGRQIEHLLWGWCLAVCNEYPHGDIHFPFRDEAHRKELWFLHREYLLSLEGIERVPGVLGRYPLEKGQKPHAMKQYEIALQKGTRR